MGISKALAIFWKLQISTLKDFIRDRGEGMAGALSYFQLLSMAPLCGFVIFLSTKIFGYETSHDVVVPLLHLWFPEQFIIIIKVFLKYAEHLDQSSFNTLSWVAGIALALATKEYFAQLKDSIEIMWNDRREKFGLRPMARKALEDYSVTIISLLIIFLLLTVRIVLPFPIVEDISVYRKFDQGLIIFFRLIFEFLILFCLSQFVLWVGPTYKITFREAIPGALLFSVLQIVGREIMKFHMHSMTYKETIELVIVMLAWMYYYNLVFIYCAQFSKCLIARKRGIDIQSLKYE